jgi:hypothetical protein
VISLLSRLPRECILASETHRRRHSRPAFGADAVQRLPSSAKTRASRATTRLASPAISASPFVCRSKPGELCIYPTAICGAPFSIVVDMYLVRIAFQLLEIHRAVLSTRGTELDS